MSEFVKYPRTPHVAGSRHGVGDDLVDVSVESLREASASGATLVFEEKFDGANCAVSFVDGVLSLQSRGHRLTGGPRETQFALAKRWAGAHEQAFRAVLGDRYVMFGEWCFAKHTVFYDVLPHYFLEFDVFDRREHVFLSTPARHALLADVPVCHVPVLRSGSLQRNETVGSFLAVSTAKSAGWRSVLCAQAAAAGVDVVSAVAQTDPSDFAEGVYVKVELGDETVGRAKWVRSDFTSLLSDTGHWSERPMIVNMLADPDVLWRA